MKVLLVLLTAIALTAVIPTSKAQDCIEINPPDYHIDPLDCQNNPPSVVGETGAYCAQLDHYRVADPRPLPFATTDSSTKPAFDGGTCYYVGPVVWDTRDRVYVGKLYDYTP